MKDERRRRLLADRKLQGALLVHTTLYWFYTLFSVALIALCWIVFIQKPATNSDLFGQLWTNCGPLLIGSIVILPLVLLDCLRLSNRFAGPMLRFRRAMSELANEKPAQPIHLRDGDYWLEFAQDVNRVAELLAATRTESSAGERPTTTPAVAERPAASSPASESTSKKAAQVEDSATPTATPVPPAAPIELGNGGKPSSASIYSVS